MPVAQLDRVSDSDSEGRAFESHRAYQKSCILKKSKCSFFLYFQSVPYFRTSPADRRDTGLSVTDAQVEQILAGKDCSMDKTVKEIIQR